MVPDPKIEKQCNSLLAALATGIKTSNKIATDYSLTGRAFPKDTVGDCVKTGDSFSRSMAFSEFSTMNSQAKSIINKLLTKTLGAVSSSHSCSTSTSVDDAILFDATCSVSATILDRISTILNTDTNNSTNAPPAPPILERSQQTFSFSSDNGRTAPFVPRLYGSKPHAIVPLSLMPIDGFVIPTADEDAAFQNNSLSNLNSNSASNFVTPPIHYAHPYETEIKSLSFQPWQLNLPSKFKYDDYTKLHGHNNTLHNPSNLDPITKQLNLQNCTYIDTEQALIKMCETLNEPDVREIAVDLEHHHLTSFGGFTCLIQISIRPKNVRRALFFNEPSDDNDIPDDSVCDFLVDALALLRSIPHHLAPIFADPSVVKVMHGANSDVIWLQRDFGIYIVNLFDTGRAARTLKYPSFSLAHLLTKFSGINVDKTHQTSDWRQRPLSREMVRERCE